MKTRREIRGVEQATAIVASLVRAEELVTQAEAALREAEELMKKDAISGAGADLNAREVRELHTVLRVGFHRGLRRVVNDWDGFLAARKR